MSAPFGSLPTRWDPESGPSDHVAVVLPGAGYSPSHPLLEFGRQALVQHGWTVQQVWWDWPARRESTPEERLAFVADQARTSLDREAAASRLMVLAKSLGTLAAPVAAERGLPGVWLTPLFDVPGPIEAMASAAAGSDTLASAPQLVVGGLADPSWDPTRARETGAAVVDFEGASHLLHVPGDAVRSAEIQLEISKALDSFLTRLG